MVLFRDYLSCSNYQPAAAREDNFLAHVLIALQGISMHVTGRTCIWMCLSLVEKHYLISIWNSSCRPSPKNAHFVSVRAQTLVILPLTLGLAARYAWKWRDCWRWCLTGGITSQPTRPWTSQFALISLIGHSETCDWPTCFLLVHPCGKKLLGTRSNKQGEGNWTAPTPVSPIQFVIHTNRSSSASCWTATQLSPAENKKLDVSKCRRNTDPWACSGTRSKTVFSCHHKDS